jgi:hypothetical protein
MIKCKATTSGAGRRSKRTKTTKAFAWKSNDWKLNHALTDQVSLLVSHTNVKQLLVKKFLDIDPDDNNEVQPPKTCALSCCPTATG